MVRNNTQISCGIHGCLVSRSLKCARKTFFKLSKHHKQPGLLTQGRFSGFMALTPKADHYRLSRKSDSSDQATFLKSSTVQCWRARVNCSVCFCLTGMEPDLVFCCCSPFTSNLDVLFTLRNCFVRHSCKSDESELPQPLKQVWPFFSDLTYQQGVCLDVFHIILSRLYAVSREHLRRSAV